MKMWRSVVSRASSSYKQESTRFITNQSTKVLHSISTQTLAPFLYSSIVPKTSDFQNPSFSLFSSPYSSTNLSFSESNDDAFSDVTSAVGFDQDGSALVSLESENGDLGVLNGELGLNLNETEDFGNEDGAGVELESIEVGDESEEIHKIDNEKLESVLSLLQSSVDESVESSLEGMDLRLNEKFVVKVLETPLISGENLVLFFKWAMEKPGFSVTSGAVEALVLAISVQLKRNNAYAVWDLVKDIGEKKNGVLKAEILNELISLFSRLGKGKAGFEVFNKFEEFGCCPNEDTYYFTIEALCRRSIYDWAGLVCEKMLSAGCLPNSEKSGKIMSLLCKGCKTRDAHSVYLFAKEKNKLPSHSSVNYLIKSLSDKNETVALALEMLDDFSEDAIKHAIKPFSYVMRGLCRIKDTEKAKKLLFKMIEKGPRPGNAVFNSVIDALSKAGDLDEAKKIVSLMENRGLKPDVYTYTVIMSGYAKGGQMDDACKVLSEAKKKHAKLTPVTYHTLIRGYCKLEEFDKALSLMAEMKDYGVRPNADEYNKLIQSLCLKALDWETAEKLFEEMKENGLHLNGITQGLIRAVKEMEEVELNSSEEIDA